MPVHWSAPNGRAVANVGPGDVRASLPPHASFVAPINAPLDMAPNASPVLASISMGQGVPPGALGLGGSARPSTSGMINPSRSQLRNDVLRNRSRPNTNQGRRPGTTSALDSNGSVRSRNSNEVGFSVVESSDGSITSVPVDNRPRAKSASGPRAPWGSGAGRPGGESLSDYHLTSTSYSPPKTQPPPTIRPSHATVTNHAPARHFATSDRWAGPGNQDQVGAGQAAKGAGQEKGEGGRR